MLTHVLSGATGDLTAPPISAMLMSQALLHEGDDLLTQMPLLPADSVQPTEPPALNARSPLQRALATFHDHMLSQGFSLYTVKAFDSDLGLLASYLGAGAAVDSIDTHKLEQFLAYLRQLGERVRVDTAFLEIPGLHRIDSDLHAYRGIQL